MAEYRGGHPLAGYIHLMQNANLTWSQDPGDVTELLSGKFFQVLGRSTAHQLWSSAMVISPLMRGLFGLEWNEPANTLTITPHLPAQWPGATLHNVPFGKSRLDISMQREGANLAVRVQGTPPGFHLASATPGARQQGDVFLIPLPRVEVGVDENLPPFGSETTQLKVLEEQYQQHALTLSFAAPAGSDVSMDVRENGAPVKLAVTGAALQPADSGLQKLRIRFSPEQAAQPEAWLRKTVTLRW